MTAAVFRTAGGLVLLALPALAQDLPISLDGAVGGLVMTEAGVPVQGYPVLIQQQDGKNSLLTFTDAQGGYSAVGLGPGDYCATPLTEAGLCTQFQVMDGKAAPDGMLLLPDISVKTGLVAPGG